MILHDAFSAELFGWLLAALPFVIAGAALPKTDDHPDDEGEDLELVRRARAGDRSAFNRLIRKYETRVFRFCFRMLNNVEEAEELTQDVFVKLYGNLKVFRGDSKFSTWLFQIAKNLTLNQLKYLKRRKFYTASSLDAPRNATEGDGSIDVQDETADAQEQVEGQELRRLVRSKIRNLREDYRIPLLLRDIEGLRYDEIAEVLDLPEGTVKSRIHKARLALKDSLDSYLKP